MSDLTVWGLDIRIWQVIATLLGAATTASIAVAAWVIAYRNNFGWKPVVLFTSEGSGGDCKEGSMVVRVSFDVINRRKYPIVIRSVMMNFEKTRFEHDLTAKLKWVKWPDASFLTLLESVEIGGNDREQFEAGGVVPRDVGLYWKDKGELFLTYFDLKSNKNKSIRQKFEVDLDDRGEHAEDGEGWDDPS